jgi:hypothetical protein
MEVVMRAVIGVAAMVLVLAGCEERHLRGVVGAPGGAGSASVRVLVEDDPAGAEPVPVAGNRPTVSLRFSAALQRSGVEATVPDTGTLFAQVAIGLGGGTVVSTADSVPAGDYLTVRLTILEAMLAMPGAAPVDLLGGSPAPSITRNVTRAVIDGELLTIRVDLNSDDWLVPNPTPGTGPDFLFTGPTDFLDALAITLP